MKIVHINCSYGLADSTGRNALEMHDWFRRHNMKSYCFISSFNDASKEDKYIKLYSSKWDMKLHALESRLTGKQGYFSKNTTRRLVSNLKTINPDVVILSVLHNNSINFPLLFQFFKEHETSVLIILHDCFYFTGHCMHFTQYNCKKFITGCNHCPAIHSDNVSWLFDTSNQCWNDKKKWFSSIHKLAVIGVSDWITDQAKQSFLMTAKYIKRIYNWIDRDIFFPKESSILRAKYGIPLERSIILCVASVWADKRGIRSSKGFNEIINVAKNLQDTLIILIGKYDDGHVILPPNIMTIGVIKDMNVLADYFSMADVFMNPSHQETFGKTTAEAICCGTPVVAYDATACTELVGDTRGKLVNFENEFVDAVREVLKNGKEYYSEALEQFAKYNFDKYKNIEEYYKVLTELTCTHGASFSL